MRFWKTPTVKFRALVPGIDKVMPIVPARNIQHSWLNAVRIDLAEKRKDPEYLATRNTHTAKCIGISSIMRQGWILRTWQDIFIETNGDGVSCKWRTPIDQKLTEMKCDYVDFHTADQFSNFMHNWPSNALRSIIKINSPWVAEIPDGYLLLELPVAYGDDSRFTALSGLFDSAHGPAPMNAQLQWHVLNGQTIIKAGTPISQYVLVKKEKIDCEVVPYDVKYIDDDIRSLAIESRFQTNYRKLADVFKVTRN